MDLHLANRLKIPHTFVLHTYTKPTKCHYCGKLLVGVFKQGLQCKDCRYNVHKKCAEFVPRDCSGELPSGTETEEKRDASDDEQPALNFGDDQIVTPENFGAHMLIQQSQSNIPVQRLVQSVRQTKRVAGPPLKEGWLTHSTNKDPGRRRHYWRLESQCLTMFKVRRRREEERSDGMVFSRTLGPVSTEKSHSVRY